MYIGNARVTLREAIFSVAIASALFCIGFLIATQIEHSVNRRNLQYRQAARIADTNEFALAMSTDIGNAFVEGGFRAIDTVAHAKLGGEWLSICADYQKYTMHTRVVTYTVPNGRGGVSTRTRTEHYWTWDTYRTERLSSKRVEYMGCEFPFGKFDYSGVGRNYKTVDEGWHKRIKFTAIAPAFQAAAYTQLAGGTVADGTPLHDDTTIERLYESYTSSIAVAAFWCVWALVIIAAVVGFVILDNRWIED